MKYYQYKTDKSAQTQDQCITYVIDMLYLPLAQQFGLNKTIPLYNTLSGKMYTPMKQFKTCLSK